jgi:hypothetical protein
MVVARGAVLSVSGGGAMLMVKERETVSLLESVTCTVKVELP